MMKFIAECPKEYPYKATRYAQKASNYDNPQGDEQENRPQDAVSQ